MFTAVGISLRRALPRVEAAVPLAEIASVAPPVPTVELRISASPSGARVSLDGVPLAGNPWKGGLPRDPTPHRIAIEAPGFVPWTESVVLDRDWAVDIVLTGAPPAPEAHPPPPPAAPNPGARPGPPYSRQRHMDTENPYRIP